MRRILPFAAALLLTCSAVLTASAQNPPARPAEPSYATGGSSYTPNVDIELFRGANFDNGAYGTRRDLSQLDPEFERRTSSVVVYGGRWELCTERDYGGRCAVFGPGRYADLGGLDNQIASLRRIR